MAKNLHGFAGRANKATTDRILGRFSSSPGCPNPSIIRTLSSRVRVGLPTNQLLGGSKNNPLTTALLPAKRVTVITTCPLIVQSR